MARAMLRHACTGTPERAKNTGISRNSELAGSSREAEDVHFGEDRPLLVLDLPDPLRHLGAVLSDPFSAWKM
jgi:hypothetical protein